MEIKRLIPELCTTILLQNEEWIGGMYNGSYYPHSSHHKDFIFAIVAELKERGYDRDQIKMPSNMVHVLDLCTPKNGRNYVAKSINIQQKHQQLNNLISTYLTELFPETSLLVDHKSVRSKLSGASFKKEETSEKKSDNIKWEIFDTSLSREERYERYLKSLDKDSYEGKPIFNFNENYGYKELTKEKPEFTPPKIEEDDNG